MRKYNFLSGLFLMILSVGTCFMAHRLGLGNIHNPGPGLIPFGVAAILFLMSVGLILRSFFEAIKGPQKKVFKGVDWKRVILVLASLLGYGLAFNTLGFTFCTFLLMILLLGVVGRLKWWLILVISLFTVVCTHLIFVVWLECPFPNGPFGIG